MKKKFLSVTTALVMTVAFLVPMYDFDTYALDSKVEVAVEWAINIANDNSHGYSQANRYGPDYDCSSLVCSAFHNAGFNINSKGVTSNMRAMFVSQGFTWISWNKINNVSNLQRGDILLDESAHTEIYIGNNRNVGAHEDLDGVQGDSSGKEISIGGYWNGSEGVWWDGILRYEKEDIITPSKPTLSILGGTTTSATKFSWNACSNTDRYDLRIYNKGSNDALIYLPTTETSLTVNLPHGEWEANVVAVNNTSNASETYGWSDKISFSTSLGECNPSAVTNYNGHIYALYENKSYYDYAKTLCGKMGGHLATITSKAENDAVKSLMSNAKSDGYWLGGNDVASEGAWVWETGESFSYKDGWHTGEPNNDSEEDYMMIYTDGTWNDSKSDINHAWGFVLEIEPVEPAEKSEYNGHLYYRFDKYMNWTEANAYAKSIGGSLVDISDDEMDFINTLTKNNTSLYWTASKGTPNYDKDKKGFICELSKTATAVSIVSNPDKLEYYLGETIDLTGIKLKVSYKEGSDETVTSDIIATADMNTIGEKDVTVTYKGFTQTFPIRVICPKPEINLESKTDTTVEFSWSGISIADKYIVNVNGKEFTTATENRCQLTGLSPDTVYNLQIIAKKGNTVLEKSEIKSVATSPKVTFNGTGTEDNPYQIANADELILMSELINDRLSNKNFRSAYYVLANDIDMKKIAFTPIGNCSENNNAYFTGNFNGNYHEIKNLNISSSKGYAGLFGRVDNTAGENNYCAITNVSVIGDVNTSCENAGGIVGSLSGGASVYGCSFTGDVYSIKNSGGIIGSINNGGIVDTSYHNGIVSGKNSGGIAGLVSKSEQTIKADTYIVGTYHHNGKISSSESHSGGIVGLAETSVNYYNNFYEKTSCNGGVDNSANDNTKAVNSTILHELAETLGSPYAKNNDNSINNGSPVFVWQLSLYDFCGDGTEESPYLINSKEDLLVLNEYLNDLSIGYLFKSAYYLQTADIDLSGVSWKPIASENNMFFMGNYNGSCHKITNMNVDSENYGGFFGRISGGTISDLAIENSTVKSNGDGGGITAIIADGAVIRNCSYIGEVTAENAGGLIGTVYGATVESSYQVGDVTGTETAGGLVGEVSEQGIEILNSHHGNGTVSATTKGGIIGKSNENAKIENSFYLKSTVSGTTTNGGLAINATIMSSLADTLGNPFVDDDYPIFSWQSDSIECATILGDLNCDVKISVADGVLMQKYILGSYSFNIQQFYNADMNNDKRVDVFDMIIMRKELIKNEVESW